MSRPIALHMCLAFGSLLFLNFATQCLAFPKVERGETAPAYTEQGQYEGMNAEDQESSSIALRHTPQQMFSEDPMIPSTGTTVMPLDKVFSTDEGTHLTESRLLQPSSPGLHAAIEPAFPASEEVHGSSQPERMSLGHRYSKAMLTTAVTATPLNPDEEGSFSSSSIQPLAEGTRSATQGFQNHVGNQLFATESQEEVSLGHSSSSYINTKEMLATNPGTEEVDLDATRRTTSLPDIHSTADTQPDGVRPSQMTADIDQAAVTKHLLATSEYALSVEPETGSQLEVLEAIVSVSTAVPAALVMSDEWDDTKLESRSQIRSPELGDNPETQMTGQPPKTTCVSLEGTEGDLSSTETSEVALRLAEDETHVGTAQLITKGGEGSPILTHQSSFTPSSLMEDIRVSTVNLFQSTGGSTASTEEDSATFFSETAASVSQYESEEYLSLGVALKDIITQEMTTAPQEPEATLPVLTQEQVTTIEVIRDSGGAEEGKESPSPVSGAAVPTQPSKRWEASDTPAFTADSPWSPEVTSAADLMDIVTGPNEEFTPVLDEPMTIPGITVEVPTISPVFPSEGRTAPPTSYPNTAASYGLEHLASEEGEEDEDEEDEEDEDEDEEDEEEDEDDKDTDALDESFDSDTELPGFTVPGVTSQEPGGESGNTDLLEGATYQVPDTMQWEQQNQGLVRSWMEKLKDKAGYMSGMLVPVGVGIAGALFILAALYSVKVMNRRRRNGFKRHKRKQREFNSMQDRVMLLADSSEDEF